MPDQIVHRAWNTIRLKQPPSRSQRDPKVMARLKADILKRGIRCPIRITPDGEVIAGEGRTIIAIELQLNEIPCIVASDLTEADKLVEEIQENALRENLSHVDLAEKVHQLVEIKSTELGERKGRPAAAAALGLTGSEVTKLLGLDGCPGPVKALVAAHRLAYTSAYYISRLGDEAAMIELAERAVEFNLSRQDVADAVNGKLRASRGCKRSPIRARTNKGVQLIIPGELDPEAMIGEFTAVIEAIRRAVKFNLPLPTLTQLLKPSAN